MPRHPLFSIFSCTKRFLLLALLAISPACFALGDKLARQDESTLSLVAYSGIGLIVLFLGIAIYALITMKSKDKIIEIHDEIVSHKDEMLNRISSGVIMVGLRGNVIELNTPAAKLLGREKSRVINQPLVNFFGEESKGAINKAMDTTEISKMVVNAPASNIELRLSIAKNTSMYDGVAFVICIEDVNSYEKEIKATKLSLVELNELTELLYLGQMSIDFESESFEANQILSTILGHGDKVFGDFEALNRLICPNNAAFWKQSFELAKEQHEVDFRTVFQSIEFKVPVRVVAISTAKNSKGKSTAFKLLVIDETEIRSNQIKQYSSEQKVKAIMNVSLHPLYVLDDECRIVSCNSPFERMFGVRLAEIKNKRFDLLNLVPEDINILHNPDETPVTIGRALNREFNAKVGRKSDLLPADAPLSFNDENDGNTTLHLRVTLQAFGDDKNQRSGFAGMFQDLTLLTETQLQLEAERAHFSNLLDIAPIAVATIDSEDKIVHANTAMTERLGLNEKELKKGTFYQLFNDADSAGRAAKQLHQTGRLRGFHTSLRGKNEVMHPSELHIDSFGKEKEQYVCWVSDRSGEQFQEDKFHGLLEHSSMPMAILDEKGFSNVNPAACEFFGVENEDDLWGFAPYSIDLNIDEGEAYELERIVNKVKYDGRAKTINWEHQVGTTSRPCQATYIPVYKGKEFDSILCMWTNLTEIIQADQARLEAITAHKEAEREVAENQSLLRSSHEQLATKLKDLRNTETKLQSVQDDLSEAKIDYITLQEQHQSVTDNLHKVQNEYSQSREMLSEAQEVNNSLTEQLELSTKKVNNLQAQRNQISNELQLSEKNYKEAQTQLEASEANTKQLQSEQQHQQEKMQAYVAQIDSLKQSITDKDAEINEVGSQITGLQEQLHNSDSNSAKLKQALINQRKASEEAETQRRELEQTYKIAQSELTNKVRHVEHLQNEMQQFEEMSKQEKGDMAAQQSKLEQELADRQQILQETQEALDEAKRIAEQEKLEKQKQQEEMQRVEAELAEAEKHAAQKLQEMKEADEERLAEQQRLQDELKAKQQKLLETEQVLSDANKQTEAEKAEKLKQLELFDKLQAELQEIERHSAEQTVIIEHSGKQWEEHQSQLTSEVEAKRQQLQDSQQKLDEIQQQAESEKLARLEKEQKLEQLAAELIDVESRANQQRETLEGNEEQWIAHRKQLEQELADRQQVLQETQEALDEAKQIAEQEKLEKQKQQEEMQRVEAELVEAEQHAERNLQEMKLADEARLAEQQRLQDELKAKQQKLLETEQVLSDANQQTEAEKAEKLMQQELFDKLQAELQEIEQHSADQKTIIEQSGKQWEEHQSQLTSEVEAKRQQLQDSQQKLDEIQQQAEAEKLARLEKEQKLEQLSLELVDVESRANKQREMLEGSEEQWTAHHKQIEEQKKQLQQALVAAEEQNTSLQKKLKGNLTELQQAESQVSETQSAEHKLQDELNSAKAQQEELEAHIKQQEEQELALKKQVEEQQATLVGREQSIQSMQQKQEQLQAELLAVQQEYSESKQSLNKQQDNQSGLSEQLAALEQELHTSKAQLDDKEQALQQAQHQLQSNEVILAEQEDALVAAHKEELQQVQVQKKTQIQESADPVEESAIAKMPMPENPSMWFDLLPYLQQQGQVDSLSTALNGLISELETVIKSTDDAVMQDNNGEILRGARKLVQTGKKVNADALFDVVSRLDVDCGSGMVDNISISWPNTRKAFSNTLRVIYENLHG
ncbi:MAG: epidermal growth factor receptor substrate 15 [Glaciecola sp.]|jgi:epidermal growth factor receptor substrate 15